MFVDKLFKNKTQMIVYIILFIIMLAGFIFFGTRDYSKDDITNTSSTEISEVQGFKIITSEEILDYVKGDNVIVLFGIKNSEWVNSYSNIVKNVAALNGIEDIYYYDITEDRKNSNGIYQAVVEYLNDYITYLDDGTSNIYTPTLFVKINGVVNLFDDSSSLIKGIITPEEYWTNYKINETRNILDEVFKNYKEMITDDGQTQQD